MLQTDFVAEIDHLEAKAAPMAAAELRALMDRVWPLEMRSEAWSEVAGALASVVEEFPQVGSFAVEQIEATPRNREDFREQEALEAAERMARARPG